MSEASVDLNKMAQAAKRPAKTSAASVVSAAKKTPVKRESTGADEETRDVLGALRGAMGEESALVLGDDKLVMKIKGVISTRCATLDVAIGRGGVPLGRLTVLHGAEGCGKTTVALQLVAECQAKGGLAVYFDKEYKLDPDYAQKLGVDPKRLIISQPSTLEQILNGINKLLDKVKERRERTKERRPVIIVLDSINAAVAKAVIEGDADSNHVAPEARVWSRHLPKIIEKASREDVALVFISQVRKKINVMYGDGDTIAGGESVKFYASLIIKIVRVGSEVVNGSKTANKIEAECKKNQISPPFKKASFLIRFGRGVDRESALLVAAEQKGLLKVKAGHYVLAGAELGHGLAKCAQRLRADPELAAKLVADLNKEMGWA